MPKVLQWFRQRSWRFAIVFTLALRSCALRLVQQLLIFRRGTGRQGRLLENVLQMFSGLGLERFPGRAGTSVRRQDALHGRKRESVVAAGPLQGFHQVLVPIGSEQAENPEGFILAAASGLYDPLQESDRFYSQLGEALFQQ